MTTPRPRRRTRRFLQFSLRALLVFVLLVSIGMGWLATKLERARRQKEAVEAFEKAGAGVAYEYACEEAGYDFPFTPYPDSPLPAWLRESLGDDFFFGVSAVFADDISDEQMKLLSRIPTLRYLLIRDGHITDAGLEHLEGLPNLETLYILDAPIGDLGLEYLEGLGNLETLDLWGTQATPEGVSKLQEALPDCEIICVPSLKSLRGGA